MMNKIGKKDPSFAISVQAVPQKVKSQCSIYGGWFPTVQVKEPHHIISSLERAVTVKQAISDTAYSPDRGMERIVATSLPVLRWNKGISTTEHTIRFRGEFCGGTKVNKFDLLCGRIVKNVLVLEVSVVDVLKSEVVDSVDQLSDYVSRFSIIYDLLIFNVREEVYKSRVVLHHQIPEGEFVAEVD